VLHVMPITYMSDPSMHGSERTGVRCIQVHSRATPASAFITIQVQYALATSASAAAPMKHLPETTHASMISKITNHASNQQRAPRLPELPVCHLILTRNHSRLQHQYAEPSQRHQTFYNYPCLVSIVCSPQWPIY
jgi:hypothetical protein